jgi:beta-lactamase regulating signal transducer with metallopeptidase domain
MSALEFFCGRLVSVTVWLAVAAIAVQLLLWIVRPISPRVHRLAWACVILSGIFFMRMPINVSEHRLEQAVPKPLQVVVAPLAETSRRFELAVNEPPSQPTERFPGAIRSPESRGLGNSPDDFRNSTEISQSTTDANVAVSEWTWRRVAALAWGLGAVAVLGLNFAGYFRFVRRTCRMRAASAEMSREWAELLIARHVGRAIPILVSDKFGPAFCLTPAGYRLIIPENRWTSLSQVERLGILRHELAHYERNDLFQSLLVRGVVVLHWFNPAAWWAQRQFERAGEWACDDVAGGRDGRVEFAKVLMQLGGARFPSVPLADAVAGGPLHSRIRRLLSLSPIIDRPWKTLVVTTLSVALIAFALVRINRVADAASGDPPAAANQPQSPAAVSSNGAKTNLGPPADAGVVTGQVFDANGKAPVPRALVTLQRGGGIWQTRSDLQGRFRFEKRGADWYDVFASKANLVSNKQHIRNSEQEDSPKSHFPTVRLSMGAGKQLRVQVASKETGRPIAEARVRLVYPDRRAVKTDAAGTARVPGLLAEKHVVVAEAAGFARWSGEVDLGTTAEESAIAVSLEPGGRVEGTVTDESGRPVERAFMDGRRVGSSDFYRLDSPRTDRLGRFHDNCLPLDTPIQMTPGHPDYLKCEPQEFTLTARNPKAELHFILKRRPHLSVEGVVTDEKGTPLAGATVFNHGHSSEEVQKTTTDAQGKFAIAELMENGFDPALDVRAKGFAPGHEIVRSAPGSAPAHVAVQLKPGHFIHGRVVGEDGKPISDAFVHFNSPGFWWGMMDDATRTDEQGRFEFDTLPDLCTFQIEHPGYAAFFDKRLEMDRPDVVTVTLSPTRTLRGHVFAADTGKPIEQFDVSDGRLPSTRFRSKDGLFALKDLYAPKDRSGRVQYFGRVEADGFQAKSLEELLAARGLSDAIVEIPLERLDLSKRTTISGRIVDDRNQPVAGAQLRLIVTSQQPASERDAHYNWILLKSEQLSQRPEWCNQYLSLVSDADGKFEFKNVLAEKFLQLAYWGKHVPEGRSLAFDKTEPRVPQTITIKLPKPAAIRGTIDQTKIPNAREIQAMLVTDPWHMFQAPLKAGQTTFEFNDLPAGAYNVLVASKLVPSKDDPRMSTSTTLASWTVHLKSGETADLKFSDAKIEAPALGDQ